MSLADLFPTLTLEKSQRRSIAIGVYSDDRITVRAPLRVSLRDIERFVIEKTPWIQKRLEHNRRHREKFPPMTCKEGDSILYLGQDYRLTLLKEKKQKVWLDQNQLCLSLKQDSAPKETVIKLLHQWFKAQATDILQDRVDLYAPLIPKPFKGIRFRRMKSRWGSCSYHGELCFNWLLIMAPIEVVDYVVIHELCHLVHHNHSQKFWNLVHTYMPDYKQHKEWLKQHGNRLMLGSGK